MREFEPSQDFVRSVMRSVHSYENKQAFRRWLFEKLPVSRPFRYALSGSGMLAGIFMPAACL